MNTRSSSGDHELPPSAARVSARSRFSAPPSTAFSTTGGPAIGSSSSYDFGTNDNFRAVPPSGKSTTSTKKSKGGINGRNFDSEDEESLGGLSSRSAMRTAAKRSSSNSSGVVAPNDSEKDFSRHRRQRSGGSVASAASSLSNSGKDRPWRTVSVSANSSAGAGGIVSSSHHHAVVANVVTPSSAATSSSSGYATSNFVVSDLSATYDATRSRSGNSTTSSKSNASVEVTAPSSDRWAQYETDDLEEEARKATSNAVVDVATRLAEKQQNREESVEVVHNHDDDDTDDDDDEDDDGQIPGPPPPMGGAPGTGYRDNIDDQDPWAINIDPQGDLDALQRNGNSLPPNVPDVIGSSIAEKNARGGSSSFSRSTTDYVKSRLSSLVPHRNSRDRNPDEYERSLPARVGSSPPSSSSVQNEHDKVRSEALKMLQIADSCLSDSRPTTPRNLSAPSSPRSSINASATAGLFRTSTGGYAMRELHGDEADEITIRGGGGGSGGGSAKREKASSLAGLDRFKNEKPSRGQHQYYDGTFTIGSRDEEDLKNYNSNGDPTSPNDDTPSTWSSRYSVERQLMAITGGLDSTRMLAKLDNLHSSREKTKSARGLYRASGYAMDGSGEDYNDYTRNSSTGVGLGGVWLWLRGTLWSDDLELNSDGTTQSLVRREKAMQRRKRFRWAMMFVISLSIVVGVLVHEINNPLGANATGGALGGGGEGDVNFYVLADAPYDFDSAGQLTRDLEALPPDAEFVVHLGNANSDLQSRCKEYGFERAAAVLKESPAPVLAIPGDLDWAACGSEEKATEALRDWNVNLGRLARNWDHPLKIDYSDDVVGNFAFLHKGVLFVSVNMVDADTAPYEATSRLERNVLWTKGKIAENANRHRALVIFGHAPPGERQSEYFTPLIRELKDLDTPVLYLHANANAMGGSFEEYAPFEEAENFKAVQLEKGGREAPTKVVVRDGRGGNMDLFLLERRDSSLERLED